MDQRPIDLVSIDVETTMRSKREGFSSSVPWCPDNSILLLGTYDGEDFIDFSDPKKQVLGFYSRENPRESIICGHNFKFDLHYIEKDCHPEFYKDMMESTIWDTSIAHYILTNQGDTFPSLEHVINHWLPDDYKWKKQDLIKRLVEEGKTTEDVTLEELSTYLEADCRATYDVAKAQIAYAVEHHMLTLVNVQCNAMKAIQRMEASGIKFDLERCYDLNEDCVKRIEAYSDDICNHISGVVGLKELSSHSDVWINSPQFWSRFLFGGTYKFKYKEPNGVWKSGKRKGEVKYSNKELTLKLEGLGVPALDVGSTRGKAGDWSVDQKVLSNLEAHLDPSSTKLLVSSLLKLREYEKLNSTYLTALPAKTWGANPACVIHPNVHQTSTETGRLSQSNPNLQNQPTLEDLKTVFVPGGGLGFINADWKQLEVIVFAYLCRDPMLMNDLSHGVDVHGEIATRVFGSSYTPHQRRIVKGIVFGIIYGGGVKRLSQQSGLKESIVWDIVYTFYKMYPSIKPYRASVQNKLIHEYKKHMIKRKDNPHAVLDSITGRRYNIPVEKKAVSSGFKYTPSWTKMCNYPVQGLATGDIVPMMLGHMHKWIAQEELPIAMVNTVHDSILFDCPLEYIGEYAPLIKEELERAPEIFENTFGAVFDLPLKVEVMYSDPEAGPCSLAGPWLTVD